MAVPPPTDNVEFVFQWGLLEVGEPAGVAEFTIWCSADEAQTDWDTSLAAWAHAAADAWTENISPVAYCDNVVWNQCYARHYGPDGKTANEQSSAGAHAWAGTASGPALPWETAMCVSEYTYTPGSFTPQGRRKRGRYFVPPMAASSLDPSNSGFFQNATIDAFLTEQATFYRNVGTDDFNIRQATPGVYSRADGVIRPTTYLATNAKFKSQRRRERKELPGRLDIAV